MFFQKFKKTSERMAQGKPQLKFERNLWITFRDNCDTDGRTTDKFWFHELCWHSQAELKIHLKIPSFPHVPLGHNHYLVASAVFISWPDRCVYLVLHWASWEPKPCDRNTSGSKGFKGYWLAILWIIIDHTKQAYLSTILHKIHINFLGVNNTKKVNS